MANALHLNGFWISRPDRERAVHKTGRDNAIPFLERYRKAWQRKFSRQRLCSGSLSTMRQQFADILCSPSQGLLIALLDHRCRRFRIDLRRFEFRMPEKLLDLL